VGFPLANPIVGLLITIAILAVLRTAVRDVFRRLMDAVDPSSSTPPKPPWLPNPE
jgi:divalent metal cation (Fe/Co/Zn/Cd) transporter